MPRVSLLVSAFLLAGLLTAPAHAAPVSQTIVVAATGTAGADDDGSGRRDEPLATLAEAQRRVRAAIAKGDVNVTVELGDGVHRLTSPLRLDAADSPADGTTVTWTAARDAKPVISGATPITGWELDDAASGVYKAAVGTGFDTRQLYVDGKLAQRAQLRLNRSDITLNANGFTLNNASLAYLAGLPDKKRIELRAMLSFTNRFTPVESITGTTVVMQQPAWNNNTYGYDTIQQPLRPATFFLQNSKSFLNEAGEWYLDTTAGVLYYKPLAGQDMAQAKVELPKLESLLQVGGTYDEPAQNLRFENLTFTGTSWLHPSTNDGYANQQTGVFISGVQPNRPADAFTSCAFGCRGFEGSRNGWAQMASAVQISAAEDVTIDGSTFVNLGSIALGIGNDANAHASGVGLGAHRVTVTGSTFTASAGGGIMVGGVRPDAHHPSDPRMVNSDITLRGNRVHATALDYLDNAGIFASYITRLTLEHNYVADLPYTGIGLGYGWGANDPGGNPEYVPRGLYDFQPVFDTPTTLSDVRVVGNHVRNVVQTLFDASCIYTLSAMPRSVIDENYCENSGQLGLYFDEGSRYISASRNVLVRTAGQWAHANNQNGNRTGDLTLIDNVATNSGITGLVNGQRGNVVRGNQIVTEATLPLEASRVVYNAGPGGTTDPQRPAVGAVLTADPLVVQGGGSTTVTVTVRNFSERRASELAVDLTVPDGWQAERVGKPVRYGIDSGVSSSETWKVTAPASVPAPVARAEIKAALTGRADQADLKVDRSLTITALNPLTSMKSHASVPSQFAEFGSQFVVMTAGTDIWQDAGGSFDEFGAIYRDDAAGATSTVTAQVTRMDNTNAWAKAGVVLRNDATGTGTSPGYAVMVATPGNGVAFQWDANGNGYLDSFSGASGVTAPVWVRLVRAGNTVAGYYSKNGTTWTKVGPTATLPGIAERQDTGLIATSHAAGVTGQFNFSDFTVS
ncbi:hypothetical protein [Herbidospora sp. RD11066]